MKTRRLIPVRLTFAVAAALMLAAAWKVSAQIVPPLPAVTIAATDPTGTEFPPVPPGMGMPQKFDPAEFTVTRTGNTDFAMDVNYSLTGTTANGIDYERLSGKVTIPAGMRSASIEVIPIYDQLEEGTESVVATIEPVVCIAIFPPPPGCYVVGEPRRAVAYIRDSTLTNFPPLVSIIATDPVASEGTNCVRWVGWSNGPAACCFTNTATFVVRRSGDTNTDLTVQYAIGGTASNGVDYLELPGVVTIPAGRRAASITVVPIDDNIREGLETVVLALKSPVDAPTNMLPSCAIRWPWRAAAVIVDNDQPRPGIGPLPDGCFHMTRAAANGTCWSIEFSTDMVNWTPVLTSPVTDGAVHFVDPETLGAPKRFYRAVPAPCSLPE